MAPLPKNTIEHFIHPGHQLTAIDGNNQEYCCGGCKTTGTGKRYRCHGCDFDLHEYCGTCPLILSSSMHQHPLSLVIRKAQGTRQVTRVCDLCKDPVEGLFYRCKECDYDIHPLCTQFPTEVRHALHTTHPLKLQSNSLPGFCAVCKDLCKGWRYMCPSCHFNIHLECILVPIVQCPQKPPQNPQPSTPQTSTQRGVPFHEPPPQFSGYYPYGFPSYGYGGYGPGYNMHNAQMHGQPMYANNFGQYNNQVGSSSSGNNQGGGGKRLGKMVFALVGQLGVGVLSNMIFGVDLSSLFA